MTIFLVFAASSIAGIVIGFLLARALPGGASSPSGEEFEELRRKSAEMSRELKTVAENRAIESSFAAQIPYIVKKLGERQSPGALPPIVVRIAKELFRPARVGFFAPAAGRDAWSLAEGIGFPADWKGTRDFSASEGMLGAAVSRRIIVMREDFTGRTQGVPSGPPSLESAGVFPDIVAPVVGGARAYGAIVLAGMPPATGKERLYVSMLADLAVNAFQNALTMESADLQASTDHLTGLYNRAHLAPRFEAELRRARSYALPISFVIFDIDHFKKVNDTWGHPAGDAVLKAIADTARATTRSSDLVVRYGGEEFAILMTTSDKEQAFVHADRLREAIATSAFRLPGVPDPVGVTISGGVATFPDDGDNTVELTHAADKALYEAKTAGRNRIGKASRTGLDGKPY